MNGVVVLSRPAALPEGTLVNVMPVNEDAGATAALPAGAPPSPVSEKQREALLGLIGMWKIDNPPNDEEVERIIEEYRMKKYGLDLHKVHQAQSHKKGMAAIYGKWPGDETDEEIERALKDLS